MIRVGMELYDVSAVVHRNPIAWLGRLLGGCKICGGPSGVHYQCVREGHLCMSCYDHYIDCKTIGGYGTIALDNPLHPFHKKVIPL